MKSWQPINFTIWAKDQRLTWKSNLQNYHIWLIMPVWLPHDLHGISKLLGQCRAEVICWCGLTILICWCPWQLFYQTVKLQQYCTVPNWGFQWVWDTGQKQKSSEIAKNHRKWPEMARNNQKWSGKVMWPRRHVVWSRDHPLMVWKCKNTHLVSYGAHQRVPL